MSARGNEFRTAGGDAAEFAGEPSAHDRFDVAVVGCGPVGGVLATLLGQAGHRVVVLERHPSPYLLPRAVHFDHEVARILQSCGLGADLPRISEPGSVYEWRNAAGQTLLLLGGRATGPSGWPDSNMFWQPALEGLIEQAAADQPDVEVRRGQRVVGLDDHGDRVVLRVEDEGTGTTGTVQARHVVGCDGANSTVRELIGAGVTDLGFFYDWLIVDVVLDEPRVFDPINLQICDPVRPTTAVSGGPGRRRWEFMRLPDETVAELDDAAKAWELLDPWGVTPGNAKLERHAVYRFQARWADRWRVGNVFLAGDAAHQMPPFAGQGMCSGIRDAANLAWKIDLVLRDLAPPAVLDAYQVERAENVRTVIEFSMALGSIICITDEAEAAGRDEAMVTPESSVAQPQPPLPGVTAGIIREGSPLAGELFVQGRVRRDGDVVLLDDVAGRGWRLVAPDVDERALPPELATWFSDLGGAIVDLRTEDDVDGTYLEWFKANGVAAVLQRPDFYVFGTASARDQVVDLVTDLRTALDHPTTTLPHQPEETS